MTLLECPELETEVVLRFVDLAQMMSVAKDDWCIIGGAALVLWGVPGVSVRDIDVILSTRDAQQILGGVTRDTPALHDSGLFRSTYYTQVGSGIEFDFMADFSVNSGGEWVAVAPKPTYRIQFGDYPILLPSREELRRVLKLFGRPKDIERLKLLETSIKS